LSRTYKIKIEGSEYEVVVGDVASSPIDVTVDGKSYSVELTPDGSVGPITPASTASAKPRPAPAPSARPAPAAAATGRSNTIIAPLPGRIVAVNVAVGDTVTRGQGVVVMESMKMEQTIASPKDGVVKNLLVQTGESVAYGQAMVELE
jgi:biotin carboxyl carrier protein